MPYRRLPTHPVPHMPANLLLEPYFRPSPLFWYRSGVSRIQCHRGSSFKPRGVCEMDTCRRMSIEGIAGLGEVKESAHFDGPGLVERIAKDIRCPGCRRAYCVEHRAQLSHGCTAPLAHNVRNDANILRKAQAKAVLAKTFPDQVGRVIPKPPPPKEAKPIVAQLRPNAAADTISQSETAKSDHSLPSSLPGQEAKNGPKSKEEKLWNIHVRKVKSLATPIPGAGSSGGPDAERRFFEWGMGSSGKVEDWEGKVERSWVPASMPLGRLLDLLMAATKTPTPKSLLDPSQNWSLLLLDNGPSNPPPRRAIPLRTDLPVGGQVGDGTTVILCKGWTPGLKAEEDA